MAESEGFEPPIRFPVCRFSRPVPSTTRPTLRELLQFYYSLGCAPRQPAPNNYFPVAYNASEARSGFQDRPFQPLTHPSGSGLNILYLQTVTGFTNRFILRSGFGLQSQVGLSLRGPKRIYEIALVSSARVSEVPDRDSAGRLAYPAVRHCANLRAAPTTLPTTRTNPGRPRHGSNCPAI